MQTSTEVSLRPATSSDLEAINQVIQSAVMTWELPERVKRLSIPSYLYKPLDLDHMEIIVAENINKQIIGTAAWEQAPARDVPADNKGLLLHGIFVSPDQQHRGTGSLLFAHVEQLARHQQLDGLLVKAQTNAVGFFIAQCMRKLPVNDTIRDFENRFWKPVSGNI